MPVLLVDPEVKSILILRLQEPCGLPDTHREGPSTPSLPLLAETPVLPVAGLVGGHTTQTYLVASCGTSQ